VIEAIKKISKEKLEDINGDSIELILTNKEEWAEIIKIIANKTFEERY